MKSIDKIDHITLTPEHIERLKSRDKRFEDVDLRLRIEQELRDSTLLKAVLENASEQAAIALEELSSVDPTDQKMIIRLQAKVFRARFIAKTINEVIDKGIMAEQSLQDEQDIQLIDEKD